MSASNPNYTGKVTVPTLWDKKTKRIVNNEFVRDHPDVQFRVQRHHRRPHRLYPAGLRAEIDALNERIYHNVNNGVYRAGFAKTAARL